MEMARRSLSAGQSLRALPSTATDGSHPVCAYFSFSVEMGQSWWAGSI